MIKGGGTKAKKGQGGLSHQHWLNMMFKEQFSG